MQFDRKTLLVVAAALAVGYWAAGRGQAPTPQDRPVLRWLMKAAKSALWLALVAEPAPPQQPTRFVQSPPVGEDGYPRVDHGQGW